MNYPITKKPCDVFLIYPTLSNYAERNLLLKAIRLNAPQPKS